MASTGTGDGIPVMYNVPVILIGLFMVLFPFLIVAFLVGNVFSFSFSSFSTTRSEVVVLVVVVFVTAAVLFSIVVLDALDDAVMFA